MPFPHSEPLRNPREELTRSRKTRMERAHLDQLAQHVHVSEDGEPELGDPSGGGLLCCLGFFFCDDDFALHVSLQSNDAEEDSYHQATSQQILHGSTQTIIPEPRTNCRHKPWSSDPTFQDRQAGHHGKVSRTKRSRPSVQTNATKPFKLAEKLKRGQRPHTGQGCAVLAPRGPHLGMITHYHTQLPWLPPPELPTTLFVQGQGDALTAASARGTVPTRAGTRKARCPCRSGPREGGSAVPLGPYEETSRDRFFLSKKDLIHKDTDPQPQLRPGQALHVFRSKHVATKTSIFFTNAHKSEFCRLKLLVSQTQDPAGRVNLWHWNGSSRKRLRAGDGQGPSLKGPVTH